MSKKEIVLFQSERTGSTKPGTWMDDLRNLGYSPKEIFLMGYTEMEDLSRLGIRKGSIEGEFKVRPQKILYLE